MSGNFDEIWKKIVENQNKVYKTARGLDYTYQIRGGEMFVDRRKKSITRASVEIAFQKAIELDGKVSGPKKLKVFGASYLYPVFKEIGLIDCK